MLFQRPGVDAEQGNSGVHCTFTWRVLSQARVIQAHDEFLFRFQWLGSTQLSFLAHSPVLTPYQDSSPNLPSRGPASLSALWGPQRFTGYAECHHTGKSGHTLVVSLQVCCWFHGPPEEGSTKALLCIISHRSIFVGSTAFQVPVWELSQAWLTFLLSSTLLRRGSSLSLTCPIGEAQEGC